MLDAPIRVETPLQWMTKTEVVRLISKHGFANLIGQTSSCANPRSWTHDMTHCGVCSQCIDRRFAILAAGLADSDPAANYGVDLLLGPRTEELKLRMAVSYVQFFQSFAALDDRMFLSEHPAATSALRFIRGMSSEQALAGIHGLYRKHADDVLRVLADGMKEHSWGLVTGQIPAGSILSMCSPGARIETPTPSDYERQMKDFIDALSGPTCEFAVDEASQRIVFRGGFALTGRTTI